jgi:outer membrane receptor protein involved in Fe transport
MTVRARSLFGMAVLLGMVPVAHAQTPVGGPMGPGQSNFPYWPGTPLVYPGALPPAAPLSPPGKAQQTAPVPGDAGVASTGDIQQVQAPTPVQPVLPEPSTQPPNVPIPSDTSNSVGASSFSVPSGLFGTAGGAAPSTISAGSTSSSTMAPASGAMAPTAPSPTSVLPDVVPLTSTSVVGGQEAIGRQTSDAGDLLGKSIAAPGVENRFVSPYAHDVRVRSYHTGQVVNTADGGYYFPARDDLDTALSKIDSQQIQDVTVIKGPYSVRYGPGFSFIDIETLDSPRYQGGWQAHESSSLEFKSNGSQWRGIQSGWGGDDRFGVRATIDLASGSDYRSGSQSGGPTVVEPAEYSLQNLSVAVGFDLGQYSHFEFKALHQEEYPRLLPGQIFDLNDMQTEAYTARYVLGAENVHFSLDGWFNYTKFNGNDLRQSKQTLDGAALQNFGGSGAPLFADTEGDLDSLGYRAALTFGRAGGYQITIGGDLRYLNQHINENDYFFDGANAATGATNDGVPRSHSTDPGVFIDGIMPLTERFKVKMGARADWVMNAIQNPEFMPPAPGEATLVEQNTAPASAFFFPGASFHNQYNLLSAFITPEYKLDDHTTLFGGFGMAQRPPTLTESFALGTFISVIQNPFNLYLGNPNLSPELNRQMDLGFRTNYDRVRLGANGFASWIHNYITYDFNPGFLPPFRAYALTNTPEATLFGWEAYGEYDVTPWLTPFALISYVHGEDKTANQHSIGPVSPPGAPALSANAPGTMPLWGIPPLDARLGLRFQDPEHRGLYGVEASVRIVQSQNRVAYNLQEVPTPGFTVVDLRGYYRPVRNLLLTAGVENLGDRKYQEHFDPITANVNGSQTGLYEPGINVYLGAHLEY